MVSDPAIHKSNMNFVGHTDQGGRPDGVQVIVKDKFAYVGHLFSKGFSVVDVNDPRDPKPAAFVEAPPGSWSIHLQVHGHILLVINAVDIFNTPAFQDENVYYGRNLGEVFEELDVKAAAGLRVYDIADPTAPREVGFMPIQGAGLHRIWWDGGQYAYVSALIEGYRDYILLIVDVSDPTQPVEVGRWWYPGMWKAGGEEATWEGRRYGLHHAIPAGDFAYAAWRDAGLVVLDIKDPASPRQVGHFNPSPPFGGGTHTPLPLPDRDLVLLLDEANRNNCADGIKRIWVIDVSVPENPVPISTLPIPKEEDYCRVGGHFGPHNLHENRLGSFQSSTIVFATFQNAGVRAFDISDPFEPREVGHYVPPAPDRMVDPRPGMPRVTHSCDAFVDHDGLIYLSGYNEGLYILEYTGPLS
jgi:hypothetical protein